MSCENKINFLWRAYNFLWRICVMLIRRVYDFSEISKFIVNVWTLTVHAYGE